MPEIITKHDTPARLITEWYSFNQAFKNYEGDIGYPLGKSAEVYGPTHCGKSTFCYALSGKIASEIGGNIILGDLEGFDPIFLSNILEHSGMMEGKVFHISKEKDEELLDEMTELFLEEDNRIGILDSVGAISPIGEQEGDLGDRNMGQRAFLMAQFVRRLNHVFNIFPGQKNMLMTNHVHPRLGGPGFVTPGGEAKNYLNSIQIRVKRKEEFDDGSYILEGKVIKNRWGYRNRIFYLHILSGVGVHTGLTAMFDCFMLKLASRAKTISMNGNTFGYYKTLIKKAYNGETEIFLPFIEKLQERQSPDSESEEPGDQESESN